MKTIPFLNSLDKSSKNNLKNLIINDSYLVKVLGTQKEIQLGNEKIIWFETPYGYSHLKKKVLENDYASFNEKSLDYKLENENLICIFIRPSISNLLDENLKNSLKDNNFSYIDSGNQIFYLTKKNLHHYSQEQNISKKRIAKIKKAKKLNSLLVCDTDYLIKNNLFQNLKTIYFESMKRKNASSLYYFENLWNLPTTFSLVNSIFYIAIDNFNKEILSFLIVIGDLEQHIFLSSSTYQGLKKESASFLRYHAIKSFFKNKEAQFLNMGGVNKRLGGNDSFKKSFGGLTLDYKLIFKMNKKLYFDKLKKFNLNYDEKNLRFWI